MSQSETAVARFEEGCSCAQAIFSTYAETLGIDRQTAMKVSAGFGGGMGRMARTCGAVTGAFMVLGLKHGGEDADSRENAYRKVRQFASQFEARHGSLLCKELMGCDISTPEGMQAMKERGLRSAVCTGLVRDAAEILEAAGSRAELVDVTVFYLETLNPSSRSAPAPRDGLTVLHARTPTVPYYRFLYNRVGNDYYWLSRRKLSDAELAAVLQDPRNELHVLHVDGTPAGFAELDRRQPDDIEVVQFGLTPEFIGQGLGKWFLQWTIDKAWSYQPKRLWLHTCTLDHPAALPLYTKAGFVPFKQEAIQREP
jgi:C_GCAxxG_C_C family probable redox protein